MADLVAIGMETPKIESGFSLEKDFTELIYMNPWIILYLIFNFVDSCHYFVYGPLIWDTKDNLWVDDCILIITYEPLATWSSKGHIVIGH